MVARAAVLSKLQFLPALRPRFANLNLSSTRRFSSILTKEPIHDEKAATPLGLGKMDYSTLKSPGACIADFCLLPVSIPSLHLGLGLEGHLGQRG